MRKHAVGAARFLALPTLLLAAVVAFAPGRVELAARIYALLLAAVVLALALIMLRQRYPRTRPRRRARGRELAPSSPAALARIEQAVVLGVDASFDLHHRLRPQLRTVSTELLAVRRGIVLDTEPDRARRVLGERTWELVRPERPAPEDRQARGIPISELRSVVESLERL